MPTIIVQANTAADDSVRLTLVERAVPVELHSSHYLEQLLERLSWALRDAEHVEAIAGAFEEEATASAGGGSRR